MWGKVLLCLLHPLPPHRTAQLQLSCWMEDEHPEPGCCEWGKTPALWSQQHSPPEGAGDSSSLCYRLGPQMFSAWDGQVPGEAPLTAQQQLAGMGLSAVMHCTWTSQDGQLWPCRCWEEGAKWICSSSQYVMPNTQAFPGLRGSLNRKKAPITGTQPLLWLEGADVQPHTTMQHKS